MARHSTKEASIEMKDLESRLLARTEELLKNKNCEGVAGILLSIDNEIYQTEKEARRLRLMGRLDLGVYRTLMDGYVELQRQIIELSEKHGVEKDVRNYYDLYRFEMSRLKARV